MAAGHDVVDDGHAFSVEARARDKCAAHIAGALFQRSTGLGGGGADAAYGIHVEWDLEGLGHGPRDFQCLIVAAHA